LPAAVRWRSRRLKILKVGLQLTKMASPSGVQGGGAQVPRSVDFLDAKGILPVQAFGGDAAGFAGAAACSLETKPELGGTSM
jgi:hypothetical protein